MILAYWISDPIGQLFLLRVSYSLLLQI